MRGWKFPFACLMLMAIMGPLGAQDRERQPGPATQNEEATERLRWAASQYGIISVLLEQKSFARAVEEFDKILDLGFSGDLEKPVTEAAWNIVQELREQRQFDLAHEVVDRTLSVTDRPQQLFSLRMLKAKIYQDQKMFQQAIEQLRLAQDLKEATTPN